MVFSAMRRSADTSAFAPPLSFIHAAAGAAMPMFCSATSTIVRGMPLRAIRRPIACRSLSRSALEITARTVTCTTSPSMPSLTISYFFTNPCECVRTWSILLWKSWISLVLVTLVPTAISTAWRRASSMAFSRAAGLSPLSTAAWPCAVWVCTSPVGAVCPGVCCAVACPAPRSGATPSGTLIARASSGGSSSSGTSMSSETPPSE